MISSLSAVRSSLVVLALLGGVACSSSGGDSASTTEAQSTETTASDETTAPDETEPSDDGGDPEPTETSSAALEGLLPDVSEMGDDFTEVPVNPTAAPLRETMADECPGAVMVTETLDGTVGRAFEASDGTRLTVELVGGVEPLDPAEEADLIDALNECHMVIDADGVTHSLRFSAGSDDLGDQGVRGALTDSMTSAEVTEPVGINTYFVRVVVGDVAVLVRGADGFDGVERQQLATSELTALAEEMVGRVEALLDE